MNNNTHIVYICKKETNKSPIKIYYYMNEILLSMWELLEYFIILMFIYNIPFRSHILQAVYNRECLHGNSRGGL